MKRHSRPTRQQRSARRAAWRFCCWSAGTFCRKPTKTKIGKNWKKWEEEKKIRAGEEGHEFVLMLQLLLLRPLWPWCTGSAKLRLRIRRSFARAGLGTVIQTSRHGKLSSALGKRQRRTGPNDSILLDQVILNRLHCQDRSMSRKAA